MKSLFRFKTVVDSSERTVGFLLRFLGIDSSIMLLGWLNHWMMLDFRLPCNWGFLLQVGPLLLTIGRLPDDTVYNTNSD